MPQEPEKSEVPQPEQDSPSGTQSEGAEKRLSLTEFAALLDGVRASVPLPISPDEECEDEEDDE